MVSVEMWRRHLGDEELATVGVRAGVRVSQSSGHVKIKRRNDLILERVSRVTTAGAEWIAALDHEVRDHAMKHRPVVHWHAMLFFLGVGIGPVFRSVGN